MIRRFIRKILSLKNKIVASPTDETTLLGVGAMLAKQQNSVNSKNINDYEFKIFSQFGDDGIIQYLIKNITIENDIFIEFGVGNYSESNTRFLMMNNNWSGFVMDGSTDAINKLKSQSWFWKYDLSCEAAWIDRENINTLLSKTGFSNIGLLHIDLDGNDYHVFENIDLSKLDPAIIILEYNSVFGDIRKIVVPYNPKFNRTEAHHSNLFYGASLPALNDLAIRKGYVLIGCNLGGNNAYFIRKDLLNKNVTEMSVKEAFKESKFRESRNEDYSLSYISGKERLKKIIGSQVLNIETNQLEQL